MKIRSPFYFLPIILVTIFLSGCPKKPPEILPPEKPPFVNPMEKILKEFSSVDSFQARTSIRVELERDGEERRFLLDGILLFRKPDQLRILGYHPLGISIFDALYQNNQLAIFIPFQKRAYEGDISHFEDLIEKAGDITVIAQREEDAEVPTQIMIEALDMGARILLRLKDISLNPIFGEETFRWSLPEGVEIRPIARLLRSKRIR